MKIIRVNHLDVVVDDEDYERLSKLRWTVSGGYIRQLPARPCFYMHQDVLDFPVGQIDHVNGIRHDNRKENLRLASQQQQNANCTKQKNCSSEYKGVSFDWKRGKWEAKITVNYRTIHLGRFSSEEKAAEAYNVAALRYFGEFAKLNVISK